MSKKINLQNPLNSPLMTNTEKISHVQQTLKPERVNSSIYIDRELHNQLTLYGWYHDITRGAVIEKALQVLFDKEKVDFKNIEKIKSRKA